MSWSGFNNGSNFTHPHSTAGSFSQYHNVSPGSDLSSSEEYLATPSPIPSSAHAYCSSTSPSFPFVNSLENVASGADAQINHSHSPSNIDMSSMNHGAMVPIPPQEIVTFVTSRHGSDNTSSQHNNSTCQGDVASNSLQQHNIDNNCQQLAIMNINKDLVPHMATNTTPPPVYNNGSSSSNQQSQVLLHVSPAVSSIYFK